MVTEYAVTGGGTICPGTSGLAIGLAASQQGISYQLNRDGVNTGQPLDGSGGALTWNNLTDAGIYTVTGTKISTGCTVTMQGSATLTLPTIQPPLAAISGPSIIADDPITLSTITGAGYTYQWKRDGDPVQGQTHSLLVKETGKYEVVISSNSECVSVSPPHFIYRKLTPNYNGLISSVRWRTSKAHEVTGNEYQGMYVYHYDDKYQIQEANWAIPDFTLNTFSYAANTFKVSDLSYDPNGNILSLRRYDESGARQHDFGYQYNIDPLKPQKTNQLQSIPGYAAYQYNNLGQLTAEDKVTGDDQYVEYDVTGKVLKVYTSKNATTGELEDLKVEYIYDDRGFRLAKKNLDTGKTTWYIRDAAGNVMSVYESANDDTDAERIEVPVYAAGKVGTYYPDQEGSTTYEITDHLGNVRALVRDNITVYTATMEDSGQPVATNPRVKEMQDFVNLFETEHTDAHMNHSPPSDEVSNPNRSAYLFWQSGVNGIEASDKSVGPGIMLQVKAGDKVNPEAWVRYEEKQSYSRGFDLLLLSQFLGTSFAGKGLFEGYTPAQTASTFQSAMTGANFMSDGSDEARPFAYLNYVLFSDNMSMVDAGWQRIPGDAGFTSGQEALPGMHRRVVFDETIEVEESGYIYVWVSNESENTRVWFDDLKLTHEESIVTQATDYGVWGDVIREQKADESTYRFGYQGQFAEKDKETGWNHFELREYDPVIGRWTRTDPAKQYWSSYTALGNNPISRIDPDGGYSKFGALWRSGFGLFGDLTQSGSDGEREVWGYVNDNGYYFGSDARSGVGPQRNAWYVQAWDAYWAKAHETAVVFNMHDDPNAEGWNSAPMRGLIQDNITFEANLGNAFGLGGNATYSLNLLTRGPDAGFHFTKTFQKSYGLGGAYGLNVGMYHYSGPLATMTKDQILGRTDTYMAGFGAGGSITLGYSDNKVIWSGVGLGVGETIGGSYSTGTTYEWKP